MNGDDGLSTLNEFQKKKEWLVCVDSDGCAMDTMDIKHFNCFGPCMVDEWALGEWKKEILDRWNEVNLYTMTRGINRFKGLSLALSEINEKYTAIADLDTLVNWVETSDELSNNALERAIAANPESVSLKKALCWSQAVNASIKKLPEEQILPYPLAKEALAFAHERADVAIVSSANLGAVLEEWERHQLLEHTDVVCAQDAGSKAFCIGVLLEKGYAPDHVLMCGDAPGDLAAAEKNGVYYYPILVKNEKASWQEFIDCGFDKLLSGTYGGAYQEEKKSAFLKNLGGE